MFSKKEEEWYKKFEDGTFVIKGWRSRTKEIIKPFVSPEREMLKEKLDRLGEKIGREWARDNSIRRIDTPMLQSWGNDLVAARREGADALVRKIESLEVDVDHLLA